MKCITKYNIYILYLIEPLLKKKMSSYVVTYKLWTSETN